MTESEALHSRDHLVQFDSVINTPKVNSMSLNNLSSKFDLSSLPAATLLRMLDNGKKIRPSYSTKILNASIRITIGVSWYLHLITIFKLLKY